MVVIHRPPAGWKSPLLGLPMLVRASNKEAKVLVVALRNPGRFLERESFVDLGQRPKSKGNTPSGGILRHR